MTNNSPQEKPKTPQKQSDAGEVKRSDRSVDESHINEVTNLNYVGGTVPGSMESTPPFVDESEERHDYLHRDSSDEDEGYISSPAQDAS